ncbi:MAG: DUF1214 domain-containing protein [Sphingomonas sp.]
MRGLGHYLIAIVLGVLLGAGGAVLAVRAGGFGAQERIGPWTTGKDFGTTHASAYTRAVVALYGLLALPASEARYYTADHDDAGQPIDAKCRYRVRGGALPAAWWSLTVYDPAGYLIANPADVYSVGSLGLPAAEQAQWSVVVAPTAQPGHWLPSGGNGHIALTLRTYLPAQEGKVSLTSAQLPHIVKEGC